MKRDDATTTKQDEADLAVAFTALTDFTGDALPYGGGNPFADYRRAELPFAGLTELTDRRLGAGVIAANDEFFAQRENLLVPGPAVFDPERFGHKGKVMDGWETRRRRGRSAEVPHPDPEDHDWALVRLAAPGVIRGIVVDTAHFRGNYPQAVSVEAAALSPSAGPDDVLDPAVEWTPLVPRTPVGGHAENAFAIRVERRFTHLRLCQHPIRPGWPRSAPSTWSPWNTAAPCRTPPTASTRRRSTPSSPAAPGRWTTVGRRVAAATPGTTGSSTGWPDRA